MPTCPIAIPSHTAIAGNTIGVPPAIATPILTAFTILSLAAGTMSEEDVYEYECKACPTCGSCSGMYTANSMNCLTEVLGMGLQGNGTIPAVYSERIM